MKEFSTEDLEQLYQMCQQGTAERIVALTLEQLFLHPASRDRAQAACRTVTRHRSRARDLHEDILHEAGVSLARRLALGRLQFAAAGPEAFGGWLWSIWHRACLNALRRHCRTSFRELNLADLELVEFAPDPPRENDTAGQLALLVEQLDDPALRDVLLDLAAGLSVRESARRLSLSKTTVARLRIAGLEKIRAELQENQSPDGARRCAKSTLRK